MTTPTIRNYREQNLWNWWSENKTIHGGSDKFGGKDYYEVLMKQSREPSWLGNIRHARETAYNFFTANSDFVGESNREGYTGGDKQNINDTGFNLMELMRGSGNTRFIGVHTGRTDDERGTFNYSTFMHNRSLGYSDRDMLEWLDGEGVEYREGVGLSTYNHIYDHGNPDGYTRFGGGTVGDAPTIGPIDEVGGDKFGGADYIKLLKDDWTANHSAANLARIRTQTLNYLRTAPDSAVASNNRPTDAGGDANGLWAIIDRQQRTGWQRDDRINLDPGPLDSLFGDTPGRWSDDPDTAGQFTEGDYLAARAGGHTDFNIYNYLRLNPDKRTSTAASNEYQRIRTSLINRGNSHGSESNWREWLESPLLQELGWYLQGRDSDWSGYDYGDRTYVDRGDFRVLQYYINEHFTNETGAPGLGNYRTHAHLQRLIGIDPEEGTHTIGGSWTPGEYWQQYGSAGPPDRDQGDGVDEPDLRWVEKMYASSALYQMDPSTARTRLETLETRFLNELYGGTSTVWQDTAEDHWGLDVVRETGDIGSGDIYAFNDRYFSGTGGDTSAVVDDEFYETLTRGRINWRYYQTNDAYVDAAIQLGFDELTELDEEIINEGTDDEWKRSTRRIDTIQEIRAANIYVHGRAARGGASDWDTYEDRRTLVRDSDGRYFDSPAGADDRTEITISAPSEVTITGYDQNTYWQTGLGQTGLHDRQVITEPTTITPPTINNPDVDITRPSGIPDDWTIRDSPASPPSPTPT